MLHGRPLSYAQAGSGPLLLLIHGMGGTFENWQAVIWSRWRGRTPWWRPIFPGTAPRRPAAATIHRARSRPNCAICWRPRP